MPIDAAADVPTYQTSEFSGESERFTVDLVRLETRSDIPRAFPHRHNYYHLLWMSEASGRHMLDFEQFEVRDRSVFFVSPGQIHAWASSVRPRGWVINFSPEFFVRMFPRADDIARFPFFHLASDHPVVYLSPQDHDALLPILQSIDDEFHGDDVDRLDVVRSYLLILLTRLRRLYPQRDAEDGSPQAYRLAKQFKRLLEQHFLDLASVGDYAARIGVTERQMNDAVKRTLGRTAGQAIQDRVVLEAKRLLINTDEPIAEIAWQLNFEDVAYFCRFFKKHTGLTTGDFKRQFGGPLG